MTVRTGLHAVAVPADPVGDAPRVGRIEASAADTESFHAERPRLFRIAYRILDNSVDAEDVVQDTWIRWQTTDRTKVRDARAFLATTTRRLAINATQSARARHETGIGPWLSDPADTRADPALDVERAEALDLAVLRLLERLSCAERAAYVLREAFEYPYKRISHVLAVSEENARQLVTRARDRLSSDRHTTITAGEQAQLLAALVAAAQTGDLARLERTLAAGVVPRSDGTDRGRTARIPAVERPHEGRLPEAIAA